MLKQFPLRHQLLIIIVCMAAALLVIVMPLINHNLSQVIDDDLFEDLNKAQTNYLEYGFAPTASHVEEQIYHLDIDMNREIISVSKLMTIDRAYLIFNEVVRNDLVSMINNPDIGHLDSKKVFENDTLYYSINANGNNNYTVSILYSTYSNDLVDSIQSQIIYIFYGILIVFFGVLALWVTSLISPLRKMNRFIKGVKAGKTEDIKIVRDDEIGQVYESLVEMVAELDRQNKIKEEMMHNISHDLKTPITLIQTYSQSVKDDIYPYGNKEASMDVIIENADRLESKVGQLLHLNRLDYLAQQDPEELVDMKSLIEVTANQFKFMRPEIEIDLNLEQVYFIGDQESWHIAIENLLSNGYRYVESKFIITLKNGSLVVYNDGEHFDEEIIKSMFNPYEKGNKGQFGLGLSIVKKTCDIYGYDLTAQNEEYGVSFKITVKNNGNSL